jgi:hypothetical protein
MSELVRTASSRTRTAAQWVIGLSIHHVLEYAFDYVLYPYVIYRLGLIIGGLAMGLLSLLDCLLLLWIYDKLKRDWLGIEYIKGLRHYEGPSRWRHWLGRQLSRSDALAFVLLSLRFDPFITTAYLRHGSYGGLKSRDWRIFFGSVVLCNASWALVCFGGVEVFHRL